VHEAYLRLLGQDKIEWKNRAQFFAIAAQMMRRVLLNHARARKAEKRGGGVELLSIDQVEKAEPAREVDIVALDSALKRLEGLDPELSRLVELRYFAGLTIHETADVMTVSPAKVKRDWETARAWLYRAVSAETC
jgi:RNA polymerase sigma factor (TIGR02999 family)